MKTLNYDVLKEVGYDGYIKESAPEKILQFGTGNFMRAFADYYFDCANEVADWNGKIVVVQSTSSKTIHKFNEQQGLYTVYLRGMDKGVKVNQKRIISAISRGLDATDDYAALVELACSDDLEFIMSNTTEAGIVYDPDSTFEQCPPASFPAKLTKILYERFRAGKGGLTIFACELIDNGGQVLLSCVNQHIEAWGLGDDFKKWINEENLFCSTLVDRLVTGNVKNPEELAQLEAENGYIDQLLDIGEIFGVWYIEGPKELEDRLPFKGTGMNVHVVPDVTPYKKRKVRILNGSHTGFVLGAYLAGQDNVLGCMHNETFKGFMNKMLYEEIIPTLDLDKEDLLSFAAAVEDRFANPFLDHKLLTISLNSTSKWKSRLQPSFLGYYDLKGQLPTCLTMTMAAYIAFFGCYVERREADRLICKRPLGNEYAINDDGWVLDFYAERKDMTRAELVRDVLTNLKMWDQDLTQIPGFEDAVLQNVEKICTEGAEAAYAACL